MVTKREQTHIHTHAKIICQELCTHTLYSFWQKFIYIFLIHFPSSWTYLSHPLLFHSSTLVFFSRVVPTLSLHLALFLSMLSVFISIIVSLHYSLPLTHANTNIPFSQFAQCKLFGIIFLFNAHLQTIVHILSSVKWFLVWIICVCVRVYVCVCVCWWTMARKSLNSHISPMSTETNRDRALKKWYIRRVSEKQTHIGTETHE